MTLSPGFTLYLLFVLALLGGCMGSFVNCMAYRIAHGESFTKGRSHCTHCGHVLAAKDLVPVVSFVALRGKCRYCGERIAPRYAAVELLTAVIFISLALRYGLAWETLIFCVFMLLLLATALVDLDTGILPDRFAVAGILWFAATRFLLPQPGRALLTGLLGGLMAAVPLLLFVLLADKVMKRETMGGGDIKLLFTTGLYFDWKCAILLLIVSCLFGVIFALAAKKRKGMEFPFGPAIAAAAWVVALCGAPLIQWYISLF